MTYIKRVVMQGFKSFARRTEINFDTGINVILGPNGSGKSNVSDALCFALGRLSIKSMRAAKAKNLLFMGSKYAKPSREASVEIVFENKERTFPIDSDEVTLKRIVRYNGQGIYKINDETKTRIDVVEMLAQAGIDPYGFNLILQGKIQEVVRMPSEERRKIVEEVAGISIYESRKEKSLHELAKADEKLKEINSILRERGAFLKNLDRERSQALRFKELELTVKRSKASIIQKKIHEKSKEIVSLDGSVEEKGAQRDKLRSEIAHLQKELEEKGEQINKITKHIQQASGLEQETIHTQIANLKAELEGLKVRRESYEHRKSELLRRMGEMQKSIPDLEKEIVGLREESPLMAQKAQELKKKKDELAKLEEERKKLQTFKSELHSVRERLKDRERQLSRSSVTSEGILKQLEEYARALTYPSEKECASSILENRQALAGHRKQIEEESQLMIELEKKMSVAESELKRSEHIKKDVEKIDVCPLCRSTITEEHRNHVYGDADQTIGNSKEIIEISREELQKLHSQRKAFLLAIKELEGKLSSSEIELIKHKTMKEKHEQLKRVVGEEKIFKEELVALEEKRKVLEEKTMDVSKIEEHYESKMLEIEEISSRTKQDSDTTLLYKQRDLEGMHNIIKRSTKDLEDLEVQLKELDEGLRVRRENLSHREAQEKELQQRFKQMFEERESVQKQIQTQNYKLSEVQNSARAIEDQINYLRIGKAKLDAEREALTMELTEFEGLEIIQGSIQALEERLKKAQEQLQQIGSINMRALEVYEEVKKEYDAVEVKVQTLEREKLEIMNIVAEIDHKKKKSFMKTFKAMNALFSENFSKLSSKGMAFLELENPEDIFAGGVNIVVKLAKGKYFDVTSLSGGEQTLVALSLLFAIQEYKPYYFYVFDEIDAALDKRNSERLAALLSQYMKSGQYLVVTHNDAIIMNANVLYGVSMHDGVSKVLSLQVNEARPGQSIIPVAGAAGEAQAVIAAPQDVLYKEVDISKGEAAEEEMPMDEDFASSDEEVKDGEREKKALMMDEYEE